MKKLVFFLLMISGPHLYSSPELKCSDYKNLTEITKLSKEYSFDVSCFYASMAAEHPLAKKILDYAEHSLSKSTSERQRRFALWSIRFGEKLNDNLLGVYQTEKWCSRSKCTYNNFEDYRYVFSNPNFSNHKLNVIIVEDPIKNREFVLHELTHYVIDDIFNNDSNPFPFNDPLEEEMRVAFETANANLDHYFKKTLWFPYVDLINKLRSDGMVGWISTASYAYDESEYLAEMIVRYPQALISKEADKEAALEILTPVIEYWEKHISPKLDLAGEENAKLDLAEDNEEASYLESVYKYMCSFI